MSKKTSLKQFLMKTGSFERAEDCVAAIRSGTITINSKVVDNPSYFFNLEKSLVKMNNEKLKAIKKLYFILNKPSGYLSQKAESEKTIYELLNKLNLSKEELQSLFAVGRLDKDTEGLMIVTNDGSLSNVIMDPESDMPKRYYAALEKPINRESVKLIEKGVVIETDEGKYKTKKCRIKMKSGKEIYISITEGRKRQVRNMLEAIGNKVAYLKRVSIGGLQLGNLKVGEIREIGKEEIMEKLEF